MQIPAVVSLNVKGIFVNILILESLITEKDTLELAYYFVVSIKRGISNSGTKLFFFLDKPSAKLFEEKGRLS